MVTFLQMNQCNNIEEYKQKNTNNSSTLFKSPTKLQKIRTSPETLGVSDWLVLILNFEWFSTVSFFQSQNEFLSSILQLKCNNCHTLLLKLGSVVCIQHIGINHIQIQNRLGSIQTGLFTKKIAIHCSQFMF